MYFSRQFICAGREMCNFSHHVPAPYFRREFSLDFTPEEAEIVITGQGFYELTVNGTPVTKGPLAPYISNPDDILYYDRYDLRPYLKKGKNAIGILLGNGMRNAFGGFIWDFDKAHCRGPVCLALCLTARAGEKTFSMEADETFRTHPSPITFDDLRMGCRYDARRQIPGWDTVGFDDTGWQAAQFCTMPAGEPMLCTAEPITVTEVRRAVKIEHFDALPFAYQNGLQTAAPFSESVRRNVYVYDFGVNTAGITVLRIHGTAGQKITVRHGEYLQGGKFSETTTIFIRPDATEKYLAYSQCDEYICRGGEEEIFVPRFKYDGFRYAYVEGLTPEQATPDALEFRVMSSGFPERGGFSCSSPVLNRLYEMSVRSDRANFYYFPTDCPHREKNGWTGDASMSAEHMLLHMAGENSLRVWLANIRKAQNDAGALPGIVPTGGWGFDWGNGPAWDSVLFNLPYQIYRHTGDVSVITENLPAMLRYLAYAVTKRDERGLCAYGLGDWVDPNQDVNGKIAAPLEVTDSVMLTDMATKAAFLFRQAGRRREAEYAAGFAADMREAIRAHLIDFDTMTVAGDCQTSQVFAIGAGIFEPEELPAARARLLAILHRDGDENACGMIGLRYLYHVLIDMGEAELAYRVMTSGGRTGYGSWVKRGATSMLENFPYEDGRGVCSQNHHFLADILSVMMQDFAGLRPNPTCEDPRSFAIAPVFLRELDFAEADYRGVCGRLSVRWERRTEEICLTVIVPEGMQGRLLLPPTFRTGGNDILTEGKHIFTIAKE